MSGFVLVIGNGKFELTRLEDRSWWLENEDGEGMQVWDNDLTELFTKFWGENF